MKNFQTYKIAILCSIILVALFLRIWQIGQVPLSPDWDEASLGYNAYSILHTGKDEYGMFLPVVLRSFDDYKPALYVYLTIPSIILFGLSTAAVRVPSVMFGTLTVLATYFLVKELFAHSESSEKDKNRSEVLSLLAAALLAISPWHIQFSRVAFESNVGLALNVFAILFFIKGLRRYYLLPISAFFMGINLMTYQSEKVFTPLLALTLLCIFLKSLYKVSKKYLFLALIVGLIVAAPMILATVSDSKSLMRAAGVSIFSNKTQLLMESTTKLQQSEKVHDVIGMFFYNRRVVYIRSVLSGYLAHFDLNWLFVRGDIARHHAPFMGLLYVWEMPFLFIGLYLLIFGKWKKETKLLILFWIFITPIPASITNGVPHAVRTLNFLPTFQILTALGVLASFDSLKRSKIPAFVQYAIVSVTGIFILINISYYLNQYFVQTNYYTAQDWQYGYREVLNTLPTLDPKYKHIIVENIDPMDQSYIFLLFYKKYDPRKYQSIPLPKPGATNASKNFDKFTFKHIDWNKDQHGKDTLFIGPEADFPSSINPIQVIRYPDGRIAMEMVGI